MLAKKTKAILTQAFLLAPKFRHFLFDKLAGPKNTGTHGTDRSIHLLRYFLIREAFNFTLVDGSAQIYGKRFHRVRDHLLQLI